MSLIANNARNNFLQQSDKNQQEGPGWRAVFGHIAGQKLGIVRLSAFSVGLLSAAMSAVLSAACQQKVSGMSAQPQTKTTHPQSACGFSATGGGMIFGWLSLLPSETHFNDFWLRLERKFSGFVQAQPIPEQDGQHPTFASVRAGDCLPCYRFSQGR